MSLLKIPQLERPQSLEEIPRSTGVYRIFDNQNRLLYVGKSINIQERLISHFRARGTHRKELQLFERCSYIDWTLTGAELIALLLESEEIKVLNPLLNRAQRRVKGFWAVIVEESPSGYLYLKIELLTQKNQGRALWTFHSRRSAAGFLRDFYKENQLCENYYVAQPNGKLKGETGRPCFLNQIDLCRGTCIGKESSDSFNKRLKKTIPKPKTFRGTFVILDKGRSADENSFVLVEKSTYRGFGYINSRSLKVASLETYHRHLQVRMDTRDARRILGAFILQKETIIKNL